MLREAPVGTLFGVESHIYPDCMSCVTAMTDEKTKLLFIDKEGVDKYLKEDFLAQYETIFNFYNEQMFLKATNPSFTELLPLVMMTKQK
jgi:hypothetical protein